MKIKVGDRVKLRNDEEDLIVAEIKIKSLDGYDFTFSSNDLDDDFEDESFDDDGLDFISKKGRTYMEDGSYLSDGDEDEYDIVEIIKEKKKVKKYKWIYKNLFSGELCITTDFYSEESLNDCPLPGHVLQKIDSTMIEKEIN